MKKLAIVFADGTTERIECEQWSITDNMLIIRDKTISLSADSTSDLKVRTLYPIYNIKEMTVVRD